MHSRISSKGQVTVPSEVRALLGLTPGTPVEFVVRDGEAILRKDRRTHDPVGHLYGTLKLSRRVDDVIEDLRGPRPPRRAKRR